MRFRKLIRALLGLGAAIHLGAVGLVYGIDRLRKSLQMDSKPDFTKTEPCDIRVDQNDVRIYTSGETLYRDMLESIDQAKSQICFETYVWRGDETGRRFKKALHQAAERGVEVYVIYDGFGSLKTPFWFKIFKHNPHLHIRRFPEIRTGLFFMNLRRTGREHRKLLLCDNQVAYVGGYNIGNDFGSQWRDTHVRIEGPAIRELYGGFVEFWNQFRLSHQPRLTDSRSKPWHSNIEVAFNSPARLLYPVRGMYLDTFQRAKQHLYITTAYFVPDREILTELVAASRRGVTVKVLIPEYSNHILADWVARPFYGRLLEAGVEIWLFQNAMIHAKTLTADSFRSIVGTANLDRLSLQGNYELNLQIDSHDFAKAMEKIFENDLKSARRLTFAEWQNRSRLTRILEILVQAFYPWV